MRARGALDGAVRLRARITALSPELSSEIMTAALARGAWAVSVATVLLDVLVLLDVFAARGELGIAVAPLLCLIALAALLLVAGLRPSRGMRALQLLGGVALAAAFTALLVAADPELQSDNTFMLNRPAFALVLVAPPVARPLAGLRWSAIGLGLALLSDGIASVIVGMPIRLGWGPVTAWAIYSFCYLALTLVRVRQPAWIPELSGLEADTRRLALEHEFEQRAAVTVRDSLVADLLVVASGPQRLDESMRERFRADVARLRDPLEAGDDPIPGLVAGFGWRGLGVEVSGDVEVIPRLPADTRGALVQALRAALENVIVHSGITTADLVINGRDGRLGCRVIDRGRGFDTASRTGLPAASVARLESVGGAVQIWSRPGAGTSVLVTVPAYGGGR
ncbi:MAG: hypothetical protein QM635_07575 [Microbacteriaceae bacterium]